MSLQQRRFKRGFDMVLTLLLLVPTLPVMAVVALLIRLHSPGPILFRQTRVGEGGRPFTMFKFRSMVPEAHEMEPQMLQDNGLGQVVHKREDDPRVTRIGGWLRRTSLDELPQLLNVIRGDMSLVGPRPELPWLVKQYEAGQQRRLAVPQGVTGLWQVNGRSDKPMHLFWEDDLYYVENYSFWLDIQILVRTPLAVLRGDGAF